MGIVDVLIDCLWLVILVVLPVIGLTSRRTGLTPGGAGRLLLVRTVNLSTNVTVTFLAGLFLSLTALVLTAGYALVPVGIIGTLWFHHGPESLVTMLRHSYQLKQILFVLFTGTQVVAFWMLIVTTVDRRSDVPFSFLEVSRERIRFSIPRPV